MDHHQSMYVRRGHVVKGPVSVAALRAAVRSHKISFTDLVATSPEGPWHKVVEVLASELSRVPMVTDFEVKRKFFGSGYVATYLCPYCRTSLQAEEASWGSVDICPACNRDHCVSQDARQQANNNRQAVALEQARRARDKEQRQQQKAAEREAALIQKEEARQARERERVAREAARLAEREAARESQLAEPHGGGHASGPSVGDIIDTVDAIKSIFDLFSDG
jgi:signal transduction histidine kinase